MVKSVSVRSKTYGGIAEYACLHDDDTPILIQAIEYVYHCFGGGIVKCLGTGFDYDPLAIEIALAACPGVEIEGRGGAE